MSIEQIVTAVRNDVKNCIENGTFKKEGEPCGDNEENIYTMESLYGQWAEDEFEASEAIYTLFREEFSEYI
jgi:hypothetical protein